MIFRRRSPARPGYEALPRPAIIGHRGVRFSPPDRGPPENTLTAIERAAELGADGVEIDVRPCQSGELVVLHDPTLARVAGDPRAAADLPLAELKRVRIDGQEIPTLAEALAACARLDLALNVELKRDVPSRTRAVAAAARELSRAPRLVLVVSSFDPLMLAAFAALAPGIGRALLIEPDTSHYRLDRAAHLFAAAVHAHFSMVTAQAVARWRRRGLKVLAWTVNDPAELARMFQLDLDGIITDDPAAASGALARAIRSEQVGARRQDPTSTNR